MNIYSFIYVLFAVILLIYTIKNRLDLIAVCTVCFLVYSIYCIKGIGISGYYRPNLSPKLYYLVYMQMFIILIFSAVTRYKEKRETCKTYALRGFCGNEEKDRNQSDIMDKSFSIYTAIMVCFAISNILRIGISTFASGKSNVWAQTDILFIICLYGAFPSFAYGIHYKKPSIWIPSLLVELTIFFAGARAFTATLIIIFLIEKGGELWKNRKANFRIYALGAVAVVFLLLYRMVDTMIMSGDISGAINALYNPATWEIALEFNEPRVIIANYDFAITTGIQLPIGDVLYRIIDFVPGLTTLIPIKLTYPEYFSDWLMIEVVGSKGVGGSIWGESHAMFGIVGIVVITIIWLIVIRKCNKHLLYRRQYSSFIVALGTYMAWYINRLDFNRVAQVCKIQFLCFLLWAIIFLVLGGKLKIFNRR